MRRSFIALALSAFAAAPALGQCPGGYCPRPPARPAPVAVAVVVAPPPIAPMPAQACVVAPVPRRGPVRRPLLGIFGVFHCGR